MEQHKVTIVLNSLIRHYANISQATSITGLSLLDASETRGRVELTFRVRDQANPELHYDVVFKVTRPFFDNHLKKLLEVE
ncbi:MAG: hypothetical protein IPM96_16050 [Ignavibacteria bacterium]|nr:hypothetical protein [Ignavibacteria bacterium]